MDESMDTMKNFVNDFFDSITLFKIININGIDFQAATLDDDQSEKVTDCGSSVEMLDLAVKYGFSRNDEKIIDTDYAEYMESFWQDEKVNTDETPSIKHQLGKYIIEISGLEEYLTAKQVQEQEAIELDEDGNPVINEDTDLNKTMGDLQQAANNAAR